MFEMNEMSEMFPVPEPVEGPKGKSRPTNADVEVGARSAEGRIYFSPGQRPGESETGDHRPPASVG